MAGGRLHNVRSTFIIANNLYASIIELILSWNIYQNSENKCANTSEKNKNHTQ